MNETSLIVVAVALVLNGCATFVKGSSQSIVIATPPTAGADCVLSSSRGNWTVTSPGVVSIEKGKEDLQVRCTKPGWKDSLATIPSEFEGWTAGNVLAGGIIGVAVDASTGAIHHYPDTFDVPMMPVTVPAVTSTAQTTRGR